MSNEAESVSALSSIFREITGLLRSILETTASTNAATLNRPSGATGRLADAARERDNQWQELRTTRADQMQIANAIGSLDTRIRKLDARIDKLEDTDREILYRVTPFWIRWRRGWRMTRGDE